MKKIMFFPAYLLLPFFVLFIFFVMLFSFSLYTLNIESLNSLAANKTEIVGDYVISPIDINSSSDDGAIGIVPTDSDSFIYDAEEIAEDLNSITGVKALAVAGRNIHHLVVVNTEGSNIDSSLYNRVNYSRIEQNFSDNEIRYSSVHSLSPGDFSGNMLYGVDSGNLVSYFSGENSYEFYSLRNKRGIFLSEKIVRDLELDENDDSILLLVSEDQGSTFNGKTIEIPIAGFFRIPEKECKVSENDWRDSLDYFPDTKLIFIDMEYYSELFSTTVYTEYRYDYASVSMDISDIIAEIRTLPSFSVIPCEYQNIWVRSRDMNSFKQTVLKYNSNLVINDTFSASISVARVPEIVATISRYGIVLCTLSSIILICGGYFLLGRILNHQHEAVSLLYSQGCRRSTIFTSLFLPLIIALFVLYCFTIPSFLSVMSTRYNDYLHVSPSRIIVSSLPLIIIDFILFIISSSIAVWLFIKKNTIEKLDLKGGGNER